MLVLFAAAALAHSPHDVAMFVSVAPDGTLLSSENDLFALSLDRGRTYTYRYPPQGSLSCGFALSASEQVIATGTAGVWTTSDALVTLELTDGPQVVSGCARSEDVLYVSSPDGLFASSDDGASWERVGPASDAVAVHSSTGPLVIEPSGQVSWQHDGTWFSQHLDPSVAIAAGSEGALAVTDSGQLMHNSDGMGWYPVEGAPAGGLVLEMDGSTWLLATAEEALWVSTDSGESWTLLNGSIDELATGGGGPGDGIHWFDIEVADGRWYIAGFEGLYHALPTDELWTQTNIDTVPRVRTVDWLPDGRLVVGSYGGGLYAGTPGGSDWTEYAPGVGWPYPKQILVGPGDERFELTGITLQISRDDGRTWDTVPVGLDEVGDHLALHPDYPGDPLVLVTGRGGHAGAAVSLDGGETWSAQDLPGTCTEKPINALVDGDELWVACGAMGELSHSTDRGQTWELYTTLGFQAHQLLAVEGEVWMATEQGLYTLEGELLDLPDVPVEELALGPQGLFETVPGEGLYLDGVSLDWSPLDRIEDVAVDGEGRIAVGMRDGAWFSEDDGQSWQLASAFDRVDDTLHHWTWWGFESQDMEGAYAGVVRTGEVGDRALVRVDGTDVHLVGGARGRASFRVSWEGGSEDVQVEGQEGTLDVVWALRSETTAHDIEVEVLSGTLMLDGARVWRVAGLAPDLGEEDTGDVPAGTRCRCASGRGALGWGWLVLALALVRRGSGRGEHTLQAC